MSKLKTMISYLKNHELLAVTALWMAAILAVLLGFGAYGVLSTTTGRSSGQQMQSSVPVDLSGTCAVAFKDENFGKAVAAALRIDYSRLTEEDLKKVEKLSISGKSNIKSLEDVSFMPALTQLSVTDCTVTSLNGLSAAKELRVLKLSKNKISDASELAQLTQLQTLNLTSNPIDTLPSLAALTQLKELHLDRTKISNVDFLKDSAVETLHISYTKLQQVDALRYCKNLQILYLYGYDDLDLTALQGLEQFHSIYLSERFDRSRIDFMAGKFKNADKYTKVYLALENRGLGEDE